MREQATVLAVSAASLAAAWWYLNRKGQSHEQTSPASDASPQQERSIPQAPVAWTAPPQLRTAFDFAASAFDLPRGLLERVAYQESRFRTSVRSTAGALGIMQLMPDTAAELMVDPLKPSEAIYGAAKYLRRLFDRFGSWTAALAAYNWGPGNVASYGLDSLPAETRAYVRAITSDLGL